MKELNLQASDETLYTVLDAIRETLKESGCSEDLTTTILIAAEEVYVNIAHYAYGGEPGKAVVEMGLKPDPMKIRMVFKDRGIPYNPLEKEDPDIDALEEEREIGGLGIFMVKEIMDRVEYRYENGQNILMIEKLLDEPAELASA